jgi:3-phenylpropionate/trans-cinnamate dioxygenase ferredoxin subunit
MAMIEVGKVGDIQPGTMKPFQAENKKILVANIAGKFYALDNRCTHAGGDLSKGKLEGQIVVCPRHGSRFDVTTGVCIQGPKVGIFSPAIKNEKVYVVRVEGSSVKVEVD